MNRPRQLSASSRQHGLTIVELMVGMVVALFVLAIISQVYLASRNSYRFQSASSRIQETARFAMETIGQEVRNAGYQGCGAVTFTSNVLDGVTNASEPGRGGLISVPRSRVTTARRHSRPNSRTRSTSRPPRTPAPWSYCAGIRSPNAR
ncbi:MAG: prepilin-type N-terminal cleavage/methylation domain-containing protein [Chromatiales bacterium]|nr:prepilin-type N-terminal cleavage/methylation domain-containing protein [Chromatiales bacterium]